jgi:hypothetical protein
MFRTLTTMLLGAAAVASAPAQAQPRMSPEAELERALEGRVAGTPVECINLRTVRESKIINGTAIVFGRGHTIYVNRPRVGAETLNRNDAQLVRSITNTLCRIDTIQMVDLTTGIYTGSVFLGEFVPYRRVSSGN